MAVGIPRECWFQYVSICFNWQKNLATWTPPQAKRRMEEERMAQLEKYREDYEVKAWITMIKMEGFHSHGVTPIAGWFFDGKSIDVRDPHRSPGSTFRHVLRKRRCSAPVWSWGFFSKSIQGIPDGFPIVNSGSICFNGGEYSGHIQRFLKHLVFTRVEL